MPGETGPPVALPRVTRPQCKTVQGDARPFLRGVVEIQRAFSLAVRLRLGWPRVACAVATCGRWPLRWIGQLERGLHGTTPPHVQ